MKIHKDYGFIGDEEISDPERATTLDFKPAIKSATAFEDPGMRKSFEKDIKLDSVEDVVIQYSAENLKWKNENINLNSKIQQLSQVKKELQKNQGDFKELKNAFSASQRQRQTVEAQYRTLLTKLEDVVGQKQDLSQQHHNQKKKIAELESEVLQLAKSVRESEVEKKKNEQNYKTLMESFFENQTKMISLNKAFDTNRDQILSLKSRFAKRQAQSERNSAFVESNIKLNQRLSEGISDLKKDLAETKAKNLELVRSRGRIDRENTALKKNVQSLKAQAFQLEKFRFVADKGQQKLRAEIYKLEHALKVKTSSQSANQDRSFENLKESYQDLNRKNAELKSRLQSSEETYKEQMKALKETGRGQASELSRSLIAWKAQYRELENLLLERTQESKKNILKIESLELSNHRQNETIEAQNKDILRFKALKEESEQDATEFRRKFRDANSRLSIVEMAFSAKSQENSENLLKIQNLESLSQKQQSVIAAKDKAIEDFQATIVKFSQQADCLEKKERDSQDRIEALKKLISEKSDENNVNILKIEDLEASIQTRQEMIAAKDKAIVEFQATCKKFTQQTEDLELEAKTLKDRIESLENALVKQSEESQVEFQRLNGTVDSQAEEIQSKNQEAETLKSEIERLKESLSQTVEALGFKNEEIRLLSEKIEGLEAFNSDLEVSERENISIAREKLSKDQEAFAESKKAFALESLAYDNQKRSLDLERKNLDLEKKDVQRRLQEISKKREKVKEGLSALDRKKSEIVPILEEADRIDKERKELESLKDQQEAAARALLDRQAHVTKYVGMINQTKSDIRSQVKKLSYELKMSMGLNPLKEYLTLTEREIDRLDLQLRKTPTLSAERNRLEAYLDELFEQRVFLRDNIRKVRIESEKRGAELEEVLNSPALSAALPPMPPLSRKGSL